MVQRPSDVDHEPEYVFVPLLHIVDCECKVVLNQGQPKCVWSWIRACK